MKNSNNALLLGAGILASLGAMLFFGPNTNIGQFAYGTVAFLSGCLFTLTLKI